MVEYPLISIVMPAYNAAAFVRSSIDSALRQTFVDFELLVINDCSTDETRDLVEGISAMDVRVRLINLDKNMGAPAGPRNIGVKLSRGRWIAFLDSDDIWHPSKLERQLAALDAFGARMCSTQMQDFVNESDIALSDAAPGDVEWIGFLKQLIKFRTPTSSVLIDKNLLERFPFNEDVEFKAREDLDCWLHCHEEIGRSIKITKPMMAYRIVGGQISGKKWTMFKRHLHVLKQYRFRSGCRMYFFGALFFTITHFALAIYYRRIRKSL